MLERHSAGTVGRVRLRPRVGAASFTLYNEVDIGLNELAVETPDDDGRRGIARARDPDRLRAMGFDLREGVLAGRLTDQDRLAADVGEAFRAMGRRWIDAGRPA